MDDGLFRWRTMEESRTQRLQELLRKLGKALHATVVRSDEVRECLEELHEDGWQAVGGGMGRCPNIESASMTPGFCHRSEFPLDATARRRRLCRVRSPIRTAI